MVEAIGTGNSSPRVVVFDDLGRPVGQSDSMIDGGARPVFARVQGGTYLIGVQQFSGGQRFVRLLAERFVSPQ